MLKATKTHYSGICVTKDRKEVVVQLFNGDGKIITYNNKKAEVLNSYVS